MLLDHCCHVCLSVMLVYCGQMAGWIKMPFDMEVDLGPGYLVLDGDPASSPQKGHSPQFLVHVGCGQMAGWITMPLGRDLGLGPGNNIVLDGHPAPRPKKVHSSPQLFSPYLLWQNSRASHQLLSTCYTRLI